MVSTRWAGSVHDVFEYGSVRRYHQPAEVEFDESGEPVRFTAWGRTYAVIEQAQL